MTAEYAFYVLYFMMVISCILPALTLIAGFIKSLDGEDDWALYLIIGLVLMACILFSGIIVHKHIEENSDKEAVSVEANN